MFQEVCDDCRAGLKEEVVKLLNVQLQQRR